MSKYSIRTLVRRLEKETVLALVIEPDSIEQVKTKIIQAKFRLGLEGMLKFSATPLPSGDLELTVVLMPKLGGPIKDVYTPEF